MKNFNERTTYLLNRYSLTIPTFQVAKKVGYLKFVFSEKATKIDKIFTVDLTLHM